jgi:hypothetical protein
MKKLGRPVYRNHSSRMTSPTSSKIIHTVTNTCSKALQLQPTISYGPWKTNMKKLGKPIYRNHLSRMLSLVPPPGRPYLCQSYFGIAVLLCTIIIYNCDYSYPINWYKFHLCYNGRRVCQYQKLEEKSVALVAHKLDAKIQLCILF